VSDIGWCSNVLSATTIKALCDDLAGIIPALPAGTPVGLWLSVSMLEEDLSPLQSLLERCGTPVLGLNAFPFDAFHAPVVKTNVYRPAWGTPERTTYTVAAAHALARLAPTGSQVGLTTVPIGWAGDAIDPDVAARELAGACEAISELSVACGSELHLAMEPEPGCVVGTARDLAAFVHEAGLGMWAEAGVLRACLDACHLAVMHEAPHDAVRVLEDAGVRIGRIQLSSCPETSSAADLGDFAEERWLHQTSCMAEGDLSLYTDITDAHDRPGVWRCHVHVPIHLTDVGSARTTQPHIQALLQASAGLAHPPAIEVETYAWSVLPACGRGTSLADDMAAELKWASACHAGLDA
jgi:sugar phosphate isomerase/epimerase